MAVLHMAPCKPVESTAAACLANMCIYNSDGEDDDSEGRLVQSYTSDTGVGTSTGPAPSVGLSRSNSNPSLSQAGFVQHPLDPHAAMRSDRILKVFPRSHAPWAIAV